MANENTTEGPLTATLGEQLAGKGHAPQLAEPETDVAARPRRGRSSRLPRWQVLAAGAAAYALVSGVARRVFRRR